MPDPVFRHKESKASPGFMFWKATISWQRHIKKALEPFDITHAQFVILAILLWHQKTRQTDEELTQVGIINRSRLDKMSVSNSLKKLAELRLVTRNENEHDSRAKSVCLTPQGAKLAAQIVPVVEKVDEDFFGSLDNERRTQLLLILNILDND